MIKKLYTIGDSWTYGWDLPGSNDYKVHKKGAWPTLLAREFNCELINAAWGGGSNDWMFRKTIEWVCSQDNLDEVIVIVGWVEPNRRESSTTEKLDLNTDYKGAILEIIPNDEPGMSPLEIWCNESQERYVLAINEEDFPHIEEILKPSETGEGSFPDYKYKWNQSKIEIILDNTEKRQDITDDSFKEITNLIGNLDDQPSEFDWLDVSYFIILSLY